MRKVSSRYGVTRRSLVAFGLVGGGLAIGFRIVSPSVIPLPRGNAIEEIEIFNWILIAPDNRVTIRVSQPEMGQGAMTSTAQLLAEELGVDWSKLETEFISIATHLKRGKVYGLTESAASLGVKGSELLLRRCGAQIKAMFVKAGARRFRAPEREIVAENSCVIHKPTSIKLTYAELAADAARMAVPDPLSVELKRPSDWTCIGKSVARIDIPGKTNGTAVFGIDVDLPGMKHAAIAMSPVFGGKLTSYGVDAALSQPVCTKSSKSKGATRDS